MEAGMEEDKSYVEAQENRKSRPKQCRKCSVHGRTELWKQHRMNCDYSYCTCEGCLRVEADRRRTRESQREKRRKYREKCELEELKQHMNKPAFVIPTLPNFTSLAQSFQPLKHNTTHTSPPLHSASFARPCWPMPQSPGYPSRLLPTSPPPIMMYATQYGLGLAREGMLANQHGFLPGAQPASQSTSTTNNGMASYNVPGYSVKPKTIPPPNVRLPYNPWTKLVAKVPDVHEVPKEEIDDQLEPAPPQKCACADCMQGVMQKTSGSVDAEASDFTSIKQEKEYYL